MPLACTHCKEIGHTIKCCPDVPITCSGCKSTALSSESCPQNKGQTHKKSTKRFVTLCNNTFSSQTTSWILLRLTIRVSPLAKRVSSFDSYDVPPAIDENSAPVIKKQLQRHQTQRLLNLAKQVVLYVSDLRR